MANKADKAISKLDKTTLEIASWLLLRSTPRKDALWLL